MSKPVMAIVGRPNVGKSMLFNKLAGERISIVEDTPGVTRDRIYAESSWTGRDFSIIDTGGIEPNTGNEMLKYMREQALIAIEHADVVIFVTDIRAGITANDLDVATMLLKSGRPTVLAVNKVDSVGSVPSDLYEFYNLGLGEPFPVSALHGHGTGDLLDECLKYFPDDEEAEQSEYISVAVIGRPNAGKSSLINKVLGETRMIVSEVPGTTRDAVDSKFENKYGRYTFIDTAGIRRKSRIDETIEKYSVLRALMAIDKAQVCLLLIDAEAGVTDQDARIAGFAHEKGKGIIIVVNKWDLVEKDTMTMEDTIKEIRRDLAYMTYAPICFLSALTGSRVERIFEVINRVDAENAKRVTTGLLNDILADAMVRVQPPTDKGKRLKIYYITQVSVRPPTFVIFCNEAKLFHFSYRRYIENRLRDTCGFEGTAIHIIIRQKGDTNEL